MNTSPIGATKLILRWASSLALLLLGISTAADSWMPPHELEAVSENGKFAARVAPGKGDIKPLLTVFSVDKGQATKIWETTLGNRVSPTQVHPSDDGESVVTFDNWFKAGYGDDVVAIYGRRGQLAKYSLEEFAPPPKDQSTSLPTMLGGAYGNLFPHTTSSRRWRDDCLLFFHRDANQWLFCLWLDWDNRWVAWRMNDGKLLNIGAEESSRLNVEGRRRSLEERATGFSMTALNFLGRMRFKEDRPFVESWLHETTFSTSTTLQYGSGSAPPEFSFTADSWKREAADQILARWDRNDSGVVRKGAQENYKYLGTLKGVIAFPIKPSKAQGAIRLYLIPETTLLKQWTTARPEHYLIAKLDNYFTGENGAEDSKLPQEPNFTIHGVTPGNYRLKTVWDKAAPFGLEQDIVCVPQVGDYESTNNVLVSIRKGFETKGARIDCAKLVIE